ncbi:uncharacterized protein LOC133890050 [Phragmites australis]|uniref:uncharacterized protein LOC133890050 n=1 Tax=Phragmites australis TaxID=29695 RepID=UPI002D79ECFF|nr:uncharacterized protein LOC133890050 [Phragmites australis]
MVLPAQGSMEAPEVPCFEAPEVPCLEAPGLPSMEALSKPMNWSWVPKGMDPMTVCRVAVSVGPYVEMCDDGSQEYRVTNKFRIVVGRGTTNVNDLLVALAVEETLGVVGGNWKMRAVLLQLGNWSLEAMLLLHLMPKGKHKS